MSHHFYKPFAVKYVEIYFYTFNIEVFISVSFILLTN